MTTPNWKNEAKNLLDEIKVCLINGDVGERGEGYVALSRVAAIIAAAPSGAKTKGGWKAEAKRLRNGIEDCLRTGYVGEHGEGFASLARLAELIATAPEDAQAVQDTAPTSKSASPRTNELRLDSRPSFKEFVESGEGFSPQTVRAQQGTFFILWDKAFTKGAQTVLSLPSLTENAAAWEIVDRNNEPAPWRKPSRDNPALEPKLAAEDLRTCDLHNPSGAPHRFAALYRDRPA